MSGVSTSDVQTSDPGDKRVEIFDARDDLPLHLYWELDEVSMSVWAFRVYAHFVRCAGKNGLVYPSYKTIGEKCFRSSMPKAAGATLRRKAVDAVKELLSLGLIAVQKRTNDAATEQITNRYILLAKNKWLASATKAAPDQNRGPQGGRSKGGNGGGGGAPGAPGSVGGAPPSALGAPPSAPGAPEVNQAQVNQAQVNLVPNFPAASLRSSSAAPGKRRLKAPAHIVQQFRAEGVTSVSEEAQSGAYGGEGLAVLPEGNAPSATSGESVVEYDDSILDELRADYTSPTLSPKAAFPELPQDHDNHSRLYSVASEQANVKEPIPIARPPSRDRESARPRDELFDVISAAGNLPGDQVGAAKKLFVAKGLDAEDARKVAQFIQTRLYAKPQAQLKPGAWKTGLTAYLAYAQSDHAALDALEAAISAVIYSGNPTPPPSAVYEIAGAARTLLADGVSPDDVSSMAKAFKGKFPFHDRGFEVRDVIKYTPIWKAKHRPAPKAAAAEVEAEESTPEMQARIAELTKQYGEASALSRKMYKGVS